MVGLKLPAWPPLMPPWLGCAGCPVLAPMWSLRWHCGLGWQGKLYYHQVGRKSPVSYSGCSMVTMQESWGTYSQPERGGNLGSPFCLCWPEWRHDLFCGVRLKWEQLLFFLLLGYSSFAPLARESAWTIFRASFCLYSAFLGCWLHHFHVWNIWANKKTRKLITVLFLESQVLCLSSLCLSESSCFMSNNQAFYLYLAEGYLLLHRSVSLIFILQNTCRLMISSTWNILADLNEMDRCLSPCQTAESKGKLQSLASWREKRQQKCKWRLKSGKCYNGARGELPGSTKEAVGAAWQYQGGFPEVVTLGLGLEGWTEALWVNGWKIDIVASLGWIYFCHFAIYCYC